MLKTHETSFALLQKIIDVICVIFAWWVSYLLRFHPIIPFIPAPQTGLEGTFIQLSLLMAVLNFYFFNKNGLYRSHRFNSRWTEISTVTRSHIESFIAFIITIYFLNQDKVSRIALLNYFFIGLFLLNFTRISIRNFLRYLRRRGMNLRHIVLIGSGHQLIAYIENVRRFKDAGINIIGWYDSDGLNKQYNIPIIEENFSDFIAKKNFDSIVVGHSAKNSDKQESVLKFLQNELVDIQLLPDLSYSFVGHSIVDFAGLPVININNPNLGDFDHLIKRIFDFILSLIALLILFIPMLFIAILTKLTSPGPIFYGQERMGLDGKSFKMWKFRSMKVDAENQTGAVWAVEDDPRRTRFGTFLRQTSLDELPQFWNVFVGDMSLVGPRPERPIFVDKFKSEIPAYMLRHKVKAGITGWAQVNGWRGNTSLEKRIECDIYYIKHWSLWLDIKILFMTLWKGFINKNAY